MSKAALHFERAAEADIGTFIELERKVVNAKIYGPTLKADMALHEIRANALYFIKMGEMIVGMAAYRAQPDGSVYISNVNVDPYYQRQGFARAEMEFILAKHTTAPRIDLVTHPENKNAPGLYLSLGFKVKSRKENYFGDGEPRVILTLNRG